MAVGVHIVAILNYVIMKIVSFVSKTVLRATVKHNIGTLKINKFPEKYSK